MRRDSYIDLWMWTRQIFAQSDAAKNVREVVMALNAQRATFATAVEHADDERDPVAAVVPGPQVAQPPAASKWGSFLDEDATPSDRAVHDDDSRDGVVFELPASHPAKAVKRGLSAKSSDERVSDKRSDGSAKKHQRRRADDEEAPCSVDAELEAADDVDPSNWDPRRWGAAAANVLDRSGGYYGGGDDDGGAVAREDRRAGSGGAGSAPASTLRHPAKPQGVDSAPAVKSGPSKWDAFV